MQRHGIPTAASRTFTDPALAKAYVAERGAPIVVKADGLAAGKGVVVATTVNDANAAIDAMLVGGSMGEAGARVVVEDFLAGEEASFIVLCDGRNVLPLASSQDHKRLGDGDTDRTRAAWARTRRRRSSRRRCTSASCARSSCRPSKAWPPTAFRTPDSCTPGVMVDASGTPRVLEFNCRLGDPETQPIMARLKSDLVDLAEHAVRGTLDRVEAEWDRRAALGVVIAAGGYPDAPRRGAAIEGPRCRERRRASGRARVPCRNDARGRPRRGQRRARAVRHRARRFGAAGAARGVRGDRRTPLRRHAVPDRHRPPRRRAKMTSPRNALRASPPGGTATSGAARRSPDR
jgi:hypothetical protein